MFPDFCCSGFLFPCASLCRVVAALGVLRVCCPFGHMCSDSCFVLIILFISLFFLFGGGGAAAGAGKISVANTWRLIYR